MTSLLLSIVIESISCWAKDTVDVVLWHLKYL